MKLKLILFVIICWYSNLLTAQQLEVAIDYRGKYGFVNSKSDTVIKCIYDEAFQFSEGLALIRTLLGTKLIDTLGNIYELDQLTLDGKFDFFNGTPSRAKIWKNQYINKNGKVIIDIDYKYASPFTDGVALVANIEEGKFKYGVINKSGELIIDCKFGDIEFFEKNILKLYQKGKGYCLYNTKTKLFSEWFSTINIFVDGIATVRQKSKWGFINTKLELIIPPRYYFATNFLNDKAIVDIDGNGIYYYIDYKGNILENIENVSYYPYETERLNYLSSEDTMYIIGGKYILTNEFSPDQYCCPYPNIYATKGDGAPYRFVDKNLNLITDLKFHDIEYDYENFFTVEQITNDSTRYGIIDKNGKIIFNPVYDHIEYSEGLFKIDDYEKQLS